MLSILDVFYALIKEIKKCIPDSKQYLGSIPENFESPSFLYLLAFDGENQVSYFTKDVTLDIQVIYFGPKDSYGVIDFEEKIKTMDRLKVFLSQFNLQVKERNIKFNYSFGEADNQLTIDIKFKFKDGLVNPSYNEEQAREMIKQINIRDKERIEWDFPIS